MSASWLFQDIAVGAAVAVSVAVERVSGSERIASLDVIRGIAILFILLINIPGMGSYLLPDPRIVSWTAFDQFAFGFRFTLEGTQRGLLELLFGAGILIMARKAMQPDGPVAVADLHARRNLLLIGFGLFNVFVLLWFGDILIFYGIAALLLFYFRRLRPRTLLVVGALFLAVTHIPFIQRYTERAELQASGQMLEQKAAAGVRLSGEDSEKLKQWRETVERQAPIQLSKKKQKEVAEERAWRHGSLPAYAAGIWTEWLNMYANWFFMITGEIIGTMIIGMALFKLGFIQGEWRARSYAIVLAAGYGLGLLLRLQYLAEVTTFHSGPKLGWVTFETSRLALTLGHVAAVHLLLGSAAGRRLLSPLQACGRMPLTVYLSASVITMWVLFPGFGLGLFGELGAGGLMLVATAIIGAQIAASNLWLRRYETGPFEWLWKSLAYERRMPFRKPAPAIPPGVVAAE